MLTGVRTLPDFSANNTIKGELSRLRWLVENTSGLQVKLKHWQEPEDQHFGARLEDGDVTPPQIIM